MSFLKQKKIKQKGKCTSTCQEKIISDHGCEVIGKIDKNGEAYVKCPKGKLTSTFGPEILGIKKGLFGYYDKVSNPKLSHYCLSEENEQEIYIPCKKNNKSHIYFVVFGSLSLAILILLELAKNTWNKILTNDLSIVKNIQKKRIEHLNELTKNGHLLVEDLEDILIKTEKQLLLIQNGDMSLNEFYKNTILDFKELMNELQSLQSDIEHKPIKFDSMDSINFVIDNMPTEFFHEMIKGGHFIIQGDGGKYFNSFKQLPNTFERFSSHYPSVKHSQYAKTDTLFGTKYHLLSGVNEKGDSWFQFEGAPWAFKDWTHFFNALKDVNTHKELFKDGYQHAIDAATYLSSKPIGKLFGSEMKNIGPEGASKYTEFNPIKFQYLGDNLGVGLLSNRIKTKRRSRK